MAFSTLYAITKWRRNRRSVPSHESFDQDAVIARGDPRIEKTGAKTLLVKNSEPTAFSERTYSETLCIYGTMANAVDEMPFIHCAVTRPQYTGVRVRQLK